MLLMGLDVGTTGAKACVFDETGAQRGYGFEEYGVCCPAPGLAEQDADQVFEAVKRVMRAAASASGGEIAAIGLSVQGDAVVPLDAAKKPLCSVHLGMDYRCRADANAFEARFGARALFERTGMRPHPINSLCKIRHIAHDMPDVARRARHYVTYADYILMRLGADELVIDLAMATRTMGMELATLQWDAELLNFAGINGGMLSRPVSSGTVVGTLGAALAGELGMAKGALLVAGGHDQPCAALGAGLVEGGLALDSHGTAEVVSVALDAPLLTDAMFEAHFPCYAHAVPGMFFTFSLNHTAGILLKWFVEEFCQGDAEAARAAGESVYSHVLGQAASVPTSLIVLPYFSGKGTPDCDLTAKGAILGLTLSATRHDVARAIVESLCFDLRENVVALNRAGLPVSSLRCVGGGARSAMGLQMKADVSGLPVQTLKVREAACLGAALLAGMACGAYSDAKQAAMVVATDRTYEPDPDRHARYTERYALYRRIYQMNRNLLAEL